MSRSQVSLRAARVDDAEELAVLWADSLRNAAHEDQVAELTRIVTDVTSSWQQDILLAELDGRLAGAVMLVITTVSPLNLEPTVQALSLRVMEGARRRGVGRALIDAAVQYAEDAGINHVTTAAPTGSRDANRFLARLAFGPQVVVRMASVSAVRARVEATRPLPISATTASGAGRQRTRVLAARRSMRRTRSATEPTL